MCKRQIYFEIILFDINNKSLFRVTERPFADTEWPFGVTERTFGDTEHKL